MNKFNTRTGGGTMPSLLCFANSGKTVAHSAAIFQYLLKIE